MRIDFRPFRVLLTAFEHGEGPRPVTEFRLLPDHPIAPTRWTLTGQAREEPWLVVDALLDQLESLAETMGFRYRPNTVTWTPLEQDDRPDPGSLEDPSSQLKAG